jgi:pimeloyl-ACP methyl ester carboxylesterase
MHENSVSTAADAAALIKDLESRARRFETPCGDGFVVWHAWGNGPPVLLLHGAHGSWSHWIRNIDALAAERTVWAVDIPGFGASDLPPSVDHRGIIDVLAAGLRQLLDSELPMDIVGFSFGGVIAGYLTAFYPELVRQLILVGAGGLDTPKNMIDMRSVRGLEGDERLAMQRHNLLAVMLHHPASVDTLALYLQEFNVRRGRYSPAPLVLPDRLLAILPNIARPLNAIWGEYDHPHPNPSVQEDVLRKFQPNMEFRVVADAGHWVMFERAAAFNRTLLELLRLPLRAER